MDDRESMPLTMDGDGARNPERIYLKAKGGIALSRGCFYQPMYQDVSEVLDLIKISYEEDGRKRLDYLKTFDSGAVDDSIWVPASYAGFEVEEYVAFETISEGRIILFRVRPVFLSQNKRIEYQMYNKNRRLGELVSHYLGICARMNHVRLVLVER